jgi:AraC family transcriptional regulator of adaptative response / DNA-3-methyladenine glycosylase II
VTVHLGYRPPYDWTTMLAHLRARAITGVEHVDGDRYARTVSHEGAAGTVEIAHVPERKSIVMIVRISSEPAVSAIASRVCRALDLEADVVAIGAHLAQDPLLAPLVAARPGLRAPGAWDAFELAMRAVLGQQVSVEAGRKLAGTLTQLCGTAIATTGHAHLTHLFPTAAQVAAADLGALGMPRARRETLAAVAKAALADPDLFKASRSVEETVARLRAIRGVGDWTAHYIALRASREPDAFPASDVGLLRGATKPGGERPTPAELLAQAERWRPWRAYAAQHLWAADAVPRTKE